MRGTSRDAEGLVAIEAAGIEPARADPEQPATVLELVDDVAVVLWLLGSATGSRRASSRRSTAPASKACSNAWSKPRCAASSTRAPGPSTRSCWPAARSSPATPSAPGASRSPSPRPRASTARSGSRSWRRPSSSCSLRALAEPFQEVAEDPGGRAPDQLAVDLVGRGVDRDAAADQAAHLVGVAEAVEGDGQDGLDLGRVGLEAERRGVADQADEGLDPVAGDEGRDRRAGRRRSRRRPGRGRSPPAPRAARSPRGRRRRGPGGRRGTTPRPRAGAGRRGAR